MKKRRLIITPGEPAGIGPDLAVEISQYNWPFEIVVCADFKLLKERAKLLNIPLTFLSYTNKCEPVEQKAFTLTLLSVPLRTSVIPGELNTKNSEYVLETLERACNGCLKGEFSGLITGPLHKGIINKSGIPFSGHTEFLKKYSHTKKVVMMLVTKKMRIALATTHLPIKEISNMITEELLYDTITILNKDLQKKFGIAKPHILVCGLNPHAGEDGYIGTEEINIIIPIINKMKKKGIHISGPFSADTVFQEKNLSISDVILTMYHDQGLPVLKYQGFGSGVNVTLGLPFIRTSVDHGTAINLAGKKKVNTNSLIEALKLANKMILNSK